MVTAAMKLRCLLLRRNAMTDWDRALKNRDISLQTKVCTVRAMVFPVVMYTCESWTIKKAKYWKTDAFELWWESPGLQGDQTSQSWRKSILIIHCKDWCWSSNNLVTWCEELTHWKRPWGGSWGDMGRRAWGEGDDREWDGWMASPTQWIWVWTSSRRW